MIKIDICKPSEIPAEWRGQVLGLDIETESDATFPKISLVQLYNPKEKRTIIVPVHAKWKGEVVSLDPKELEVFKDFLGTIKAVGHNLQFDLSILLHNWGVEIFPKFDTFLMARVLQLEEQALKPLIRRLHPEIQGQLKDWAQFSFGSTWMFDLDNPDQVQYAGLDPYLPFILGTDFKERIVKNKKAIDLENSYLRVTVRQRANGLLVDMEEYEKRFKEVDGEFAEKSHQLNEMAGFSCRPNSSADLKRFLIEGMGVTPTRMTAKGGVCFDKDAIEMMADNEQGNPERYAAISLVQEVKSLRSVVSSLEKIPTLLED